MVSDLLVLPQPIVPMFTENLREAFRTMSWPQWLWIALYEKFRFPCAPIYGGFPVKVSVRLFFVPYSQ